MTPENTVFVPLDQLTRKPDRDDQPTPEEREFTGEALLAKADEIIEHDHRLTPEQREQARQKFRELIAAHTMNAPVLLLNLAEDTRDEISRSAYASPDIWMQELSHGGWTLVMRQYHMDYNHEWIASVMYHTMWTFAGDVRSGTTRLLVGEEAVTDWLQSRSLTTIHKENPSSFHFETDINILNQMQRANMPIDYLGLTDEQRNKMGERIASYALVGDYQARNAYGALEYVLTIDSEEKRNQLYTHIAEELAELLPVTQTDEISASVIGLIETLAERISNVEGQPQGVKLRESARRLLLLAHLYRRRSQMAFGTPEPLPEPQRERTANVEQSPPDARLNVFAKNEPTREEVWQDIDFINHFGASNNVADYHRLNESRAHTLSGKFHEIIMDNEVPLGDLQPVLDALEVVFDAHDDARRQLLYGDMLYALARNLPTRRYDEGDLNRVVGVLEAILPRIPEGLHNYRGDNLQGPAEIAAIIADMYDYRAGFYIQADITRTGEDAGD